MDYVTCTKAYHEEAMNLVKQVFNPNITEKYPFLLGLQNLDHQVIALHENKVVGIISYTIDTLRLGLFSLKLASIGAVSTHPDFRNQGIATNLLSLAESKMKAEEVDMVVISGDLNLYKRFGADHLSLLASFTLPKVRSDLQLIEYREKEFDLYYELYQKQPFAYERSKQNFKRLIKAVVCEDPWEQSYFYGILFNGQLRSYLVLNTRPTHSHGLIREFAGSAKAVTMVTGELMDRHHVKEIRLDLVHNDPEVAILKQLGLQHHHHPFESVMKIIDFNRLIDKLQPYFEYVLGDDHDLLSIRFYDGLYQFKFKAAHYETADFNEAQHILFGPYDNPDLIGSEMGNLFSMIFPLPFVYTSNMNYQ